MSKKNYATLAPFFVCPCSIVILQVPKADSQKNGDTNCFPYKSHPASQPQTPHLKNSICGYITFWLRPPANLGAVQMSAGCANVCWVCEWRHLTQLNHTSFLTLSLNARCMFCISEVWHPRLVSFIMSFPSFHISFKIQEAGEEIAFHY